MEINIVLFLSSLLPVSVVSGLSYWGPTLTIQESTTWHNIKLEPLSNAVRSRRMKERKRRVFIIKP